MRRSLGPGGGDTRLGSQPDRLLTRDRPAGVEAWRACAGAAWGCAVAPEVRAAGVRGGPGCRPPPGRPRGCRVDAEGVRVGRPGLLGMGSAPPARVSAAPFLPGLRRIRVYVGGRLVAGGCRRAPGIARGIWTEEDRVALVPLTKQSLVEALETWS